jgi:hypothetical protein
MSDRHRKIGENIVQARIEMADVSGLMIAQEIIQLGECAGNVLIPRAVDDIEPFTGVNIVKPQKMFLAILKGRTLRGRRGRLGSRAGGRD